MAVDRKKEINSAENRKKKCAGNRKMTYLSHGKPENLKKSVENGKLFLKTEKTMPKSGGKLENRGKKPRKAGKKNNKKISTESPYNPPPMRRPTERPCFQT